MAEADPIGTFDQAVEISFLNDVLPDVLRSDFKRAVISLGIRPQGRDFLERLGARKDVQGNDKFDCYGVVYCSEVDELLDSMRRQDRLTPQLEERVNRLRSHFGAMSSCFFEFFFVDGDWEERFNENERILREKVGEGMYFNKLILEKWLGCSNNADYFRRIYEFTKEHKVVDEESGEDVLIHELEDGFFEAWAKGYFDTFQDIEEFYKVVKKEEILIDFPFGKWVRLCSSHNDFFELFELASDNDTAEFSKNDSIFNIWLNCIDSYDQLSAWVARMIFNGKIPTEQMVSRLRRGCIGLGDSGKFKNWMVKLFSSEGASEIAAVSGWRDFFDAILV